MPTPVLTERIEAPGWIASTPPDYPLRFAVVGATADEAVSNFAAAVLRWEAIEDETPTAR